jgi:hypothetical protein
VTDNALTILETDLCGHVARVLRMRMRNTKRRKGGVKERKKEKKKERDRKQRKETFLSW